MKTREAFEIVLKMAHSSYSKNFGPDEREKVALEIAEDYVNDLMREEPSTGCDYGIGG